MQLFRGNRSERIDHLITLSLVLAILLIVLAAFALLGDIFAFLGRFKQSIFLFVIGAIIAFILAPLVRIVERVVRKRWLAVVSSYLMVFLGLLLFAFLLLSPFIQEARALANNLHNPAAASLKSFDAISLDLKKLRSALVGEHLQLTSGTPLSQLVVQTTRSNIATLLRDVNGLSTAKPLPGQIRVPPSYVTPIKTPASRLEADYSKVTGSPTPTDAAALSRSVADATSAFSAASSSYQKAVSTPVLVLDLQIWADDHGINLDFHDKFGDAVQTVSQQVNSLVSNALNIALQAGNLLLSTVLVLLISIYWVSDGARFIRWLITLLPTGAQAEASYLIGRLDGILGTYIRTTVFLAALAGGVNAVGAMVFGVPYPVVIFLSIFLLSLIPVIGSLLVYVPPMLIALVFTPLPKPIYYLIWLLIAEQLITNVVGPWIGGHRIGIHPLEAMAAAFVGYPLAGVLGSLFAVPLTAFLHVCVQEIYRLRSRRGTAPRAQTEPPPAGLATRSARSRDST